jgi:hypothetical protein
MADNQIDIAIKTTGNVLVKDLKIFINDIPVDFEINNDLVKISWPKQIGIHQLKLILQTNTRVEIQQVIVDHCDLRKLLHLSWAHDNHGNRSQPATELWEAGQQWILPFGYPLSHWLTLNENKFQNGVYGQNLLEKFWQWHPTNIVLPESFPQIIRDFFQYNFDYTVVDKSKFSSMDIPYMKYVPEISKILVDQAAQEITNNLNSIIKQGHNYGSFVKNQKEFDLNDDDQWKIIWLLKSDSSKKFTEEFSAVWKLVDSLNIDFITVFIGVLPPGGFIYPHIDDVNLDNPAYAQYQGCTQIYIPLKWPEDNYIKFANAGILDSNTGPVVVNNQGFAHAVVNNSNEHRYVLAVRANIVDIFDRCTPETK